MKDNLTEVDKVEVSDASVVVYLSEVRYKISLLSTQFFNAVELSNLKTSHGPCPPLGVVYFEKATQATLGKPSVHTFPYNCDEPFK